MNARFVGGLIMVTVCQGCGCGDARKQADDAGLVDSGLADSGLLATPDGGVDAARPPGDLDVWDAFEEVQRALRSSPDHLPARAAALVETGDPEAIFEFVRDAIVTYPPSASSFHGAVEVQRWGPSATLRGGAGTPREKAELLARLYTDAGLEAEVVGGEADETRIDGRKILWRTYERAFDAGIAEAEARRLRDALGHGRRLPAVRAAIDADGQKARALAQQLQGMLSVAEATPFDFSLGPVPLVRVKVGGTWAYANPLVADADFGESLTTDTPASVGPAADSHRLLVRVEGALADAPFDRFTLVEREYGAEEVAGRRVHLSFRPPQDMVTALRQRPGDATTFLPVLSVAAPSLVGRSRDELTVLGDAVSLSGHVYRLEGEGLLVDGKAVLEGSDDATLSGRVREVQVAAEAAAFPQVTLRVRALDETGLGVEGLSAAALEVSEAEQGRSFNVIQDAAPPPKVALLFDVSTSVPAEFLGTGAVSVARDVIAALFADAPAASVRIGVINFGATWLGPWVSDIEEANSQADLLETATGGSELWAALHDAADADPSLVVVLTDAEASEPPAEADYAAIAAGPPVVVLGFGTVNQATVDDVVVHSGGQAVAVADGASAVAAALSAVRDSAAEDYLLTYVAPPGPAGQVRTVSVRINGVHATATYAIPDVPVTPPALSGVYLTVRTASGEVTRALAGFDRAFTTGAPPVSQAMLDDVAALLRGRVTIAVEAASPSPSVLLDGWIAEKLSLRRLYEAFAAQDEEAVLSALRAGLTLTPDKLMLLHAPLPGAGPDGAGVTFETGLRVAAMVQKATASGRVTRNLDLFPLSRWATASDSPGVAFQRTLEATAGLAVLEAELLRGGSTLEELAGQSLTLVAPGDARNQAGLSEEEQLRWAVLEEAFPPSYALLVPYQPGPFWAVDTTTGTVIGMLPDGSGGAAEDACGTYNDANDLLSLLGLLGSLFEVGEFGPWVALAQWEVKYVTIATIVISGGNPGGSTGLTNPAGDMACSMANDAIGDAIPGYGTYDDLVSILSDYGYDTGAPTLCGGDDGPC